MDQSRADVPGQGDRLTDHRIHGSYDNAVVESSFSSTKLKLGDQFDRCGGARKELFDYTEVFCNPRRRHSMIGQLRPAALESE